MARQIFNSFKELHNILGEDKKVDSVITEKTTIKKTPHNAQAKKKNFKKQNYNASSRPQKPLDPKLQVLFNALNWLKTTFPKAFVNHPAKVVPLKVGIGQDIAEFIKAQENPEFSLTIIRKALSMYTNNFRYLTASTKSGSHRIDLQGNIAGEITEEQAEYAHSKLNFLKERRKNKAVVPNANAQANAQESDVANQ